MQANVGDNWRIMESEREGDLSWMRGRRLEQSPHPSSSDLDPLGCVGRGGEACKWVVRTRKARGGGRWWLKPSRGGPEEGTEREETEGKREHWRGGEKLAVAVRDLVRALGEEALAGTQCKGRKRGRKGGKKKQKMSW